MSACLIDMVLTDLLPDADVSVVTNVLPTALKKVLWAAMLVGAYLVTLTFLFKACAKVEKCTGAVGVWRRVMGVREIPRVASYRCVVC